MGSIETKLMAGKEPTKGVSPAQRLARNLDVLSAAGLKDIAQDYVIMVTGFWEGDPPEGVQDICDDWWANRRKAQEKLRRKAQEKLKKV